MLNGARMTRIYSADFRRLDKLPRIEVNPRNLRLRSIRVIRVHQTIIRINSPRFEDCNPYKAHAFHETQHQILQAL